MSGQNSYKHVHVISPGQPDILPHSSSGVGYTIGMAFGVLILAILCTMLDIVGSKTHEMRMSKVPAQTDV